MIAKIHPLTGERGVNGHTLIVPRPRAEVAAYFAPRTARRAQLSIDAARSGTDLDNHWKFADALSADTAYSQAVRHTLIKRSRYEGANNAFYAGILKTYADLLIGTGPTLRMLTGNRNFNQLVEREFYRWSVEIRLRDKLWSMCHAKVQDGEAFGILQNNPALRNGSSQLDVMPFEAEQCQTATNGMDPRNCDGIIYDEFDNIVAYEILPSHPGNFNWLLPDSPIQVSARNVVHWFKRKRPGQHRGIPELTSSLSVGASSRRHREATVASAESAADVAALLTSELNPNSDVTPRDLEDFSTVEYVKRMMMVAPKGWGVTQMKSEHPNAQYAEFHRLQIGEQARPLSMPVNAAQGDSSDYSFASGKLDMLLFWRGADVDRKDCDDAILDPLFAAWFREWTILADRRDLPPTHQFDWPTHPVIDAVADASAIDTRLKNGTLQMRQVYSDQGQDLEDQLTIMAEDTFGDASDENVDKCRKMLRLINTPLHAMQAVSQLLGIEMPQPAQAPDMEPENEPAQAI